MKKTFQFKLYSSKRNKHLHNLINIAHEIYIYSLRFYRTYYKLYKKHLNKHDLQKYLTQVKKRQEKLHWNQLGSQAIQDIVDRIDRAYKQFFVCLKKRVRTSPPGMRKREKYRSFTLKQAGYELLDGKIRIGKKVYKFHKSREVAGTIKTVTIKRDALGDVYIYFSCDLPQIQSERVSTGKSEGFDFGLKTFLTASDGSEFRSPLFFMKSLKNLKNLSKKVSSKKRSSENRNKARLNFARGHRKISNQRKDFHCKLTLQLTKRYDVLCFETLNIAGMKRLWGRKVSDLGFADFMKILEFQCLKAGVEIRYAPLFYPSSKQCHNCLAIKDNLSLSEREWQCTNCNELHMRDINAAINIKRVGMSTHSLGNVRPTMATTA